MSKALKVVPAVFDPSKLVEKTNDGYKLTVTTDFIGKTFKMAADLDALITDVTPHAINLWKLYKHVVKDKSLMGDLPFFHTFDQSIPLEHGKPGSPARKAKDGHKVLNRLNYLTFKVGKIAAGDGPAKRDAQVAKDAAKAKKDAFGDFVKKYKLTAPAVKYLVLSILGMKSKDGKFTKNGKDYMTAAGLAMTE